MNFTTEETIQRLWGEFNFGPLLDSYMQLLWIVVFWFCKAM
jgi:hypothetical protein